MSAETKKQVVDSAVLLLAAAQKLPSSGDFQDIRAALMVFDSAEERLREAITEYVRGWRGSGSK